MAEEYKVSLGVDLRVNDIRERINKYNANKNNAKVRLGVRLDTRGISEQIKAINSKTPVKINVQLNAKSIQSVQSQINNIRRQIEQLGNIRINLGGVGGGGGTGRQDIQTVRIARSVDDVTRAYRELLSLQSRIGSKQQSVIKLDTSKNQQEILELSNQIENLYERYQRLHALFNGQFSDVQVDRLNRGFEITAEKLEVIKSKALDAKANLDRMNTGGSKSGASGVTRTANELTTAYNKLRNISKNIGSIKIKLSDGLDTSKDVQQIKVLEAQLQSLTSEYHKTVSKIKGKGDLSSAQWQQIQQQIDNTKIKLEQLEAEVVDAKSKLASGIQANFGNYDAQIVSLETKFKSLANQPEHIRTGIENLKTSLITLKNADSTEEIITANENYKRVLKDVEAQLRLNAAAEQQSNNTVSLAQAKQNLALKMNNWLKENSAAAKQFGGEIQNLKAQLQSCKNITGVREIGRGFENVTLRAKEAGVMSLAFIDRLRKQFTSYAAYFSAASVFMYSMMALRSMFEQVKSIDSAMTELKKVTNETDAAYNNFLSNAASRAKKLGTTVDGLVESTADFVKLGYGFEDSQELAEVANIYAVVGDEIDGVEDATQSLVSTMAAFKDEMNGLGESDFALSIVDKMNEVANNYSISSGGIGEALQRSASSLAAANNTLDESIALITAANTVVQDPEQVGRFMPTLKVAISVKLLRRTRPRKGFII